MKVMTLETGGRGADAAPLDGEAAPDLSPRPLGRTGDLKDGEGWYILVGRGPLPAGSPISLRGMKHSVFGDLALFDKAGVTLAAYWSTAEEAAAKLRRLQISASGRAAADFEGVSEIFRVAADTPQKGAAPAETQLAEDLRVLAVHYERDGRRFRRLADCEPDYFEEVFGDWPLRGDRNTGNNMRDLRREDRTWLTHHEDWVSKSGVRQNDRSVHEHKALCTALHWGTVYDQLQLPNLAMAETLNNRRQLIEHAHEGHPEQPRWDGADDWVGYKNRGSGTLIDPKREQYVAARQSEKAKILEASIKAKEVNAQWLRRGGGDGGGEGAGGDKKPKPPKGLTKGDGRGSGGAAPSGG